MVGAAAAYFPIYSYSARRILAERNTFRQRIRSPAGRPVIPPGGQLAPYTSARRTSVGGCDHPRAVKILIVFHQFQWLNVAGALEAKRPRRYNQSIQSQQCLCRPCGEATSANR